MIRLAKGEITGCLSRCSMVIEGITRNPNLPVSFTIGNVYSYSENKDIILSDYRIYCFIALLRTFSYLEDTFIDILKDNEPDLSTDLKNRIFVNPADVNKFTNKDIIRFMRNSFAHSDGNKEEFKISPNGRFASIETSKTPQGLFCVKFSVEDLMEIMNSISKIEKCIYCSYIDRENKTLQRIYINDEVNRDVIGKHLASLDNPTYSETYNEFIKYLNSNKISYELKTYNLDTNQVKLLKFFDKQLDKIIQDKEAKDMLENTIFFPFTRMLIPLGIEKVESLTDHVLIFTYLMRFPNYSFEDLRKFYYHTFFEPTHEDVPEEIYLYLKDNIVEEKSKTIAFEEYVLVNESIIQLLTYFYSSSAETNEIDIKSKKIPKKNFRNSLIHGRWFDAGDRNIMIYDVKNGKNNDYDFHFSEKVSLKVLFKDLLNLIQDSKFSNGNVEYKFPYHKR